jgi:hypothetical protein
MNFLRLPAAASLALCCGLVAGEPRPVQTRTPSAAPPAGSVTNQPGVGTITGPWGTLEYFTASIEVPLATIGAMESWPAAPMWRFATTNTALVLSQLGEAGLDAAQLAALSEPESWRKSSQSVALLPRADLLLSLTPAVRERVYALLAKHPENLFHSEPFVVYGGSVSNWLGGTGMRPALLRLVEDTAYRRHGTTYFSDVALLYSQAASDAERHQISKHLSRNPALMVSLRVTPDMDWQRIATYWSSGRKRKDVATLLESLAGNPAADKLDVLHLLPATPRKLLNTFPHPSQYIFFGQLPDCHWTSLNFFNYDPVSRLGDSTSASSYLSEYFDQVMPPFEFGDVILFTDAAGTRSIHSCVYVAGDIVFTKNGRSVLKPWTLMMFEDVAANYREGPEVHFVVYRRRSLAPD